MTALLHIVVFIVLGIMYEELVWHLKWWVVNLSYSRELDHATMAMRNKIIYCLELNILDCT